MIFKRIKNIIEFSDLILIISSFSKSNDSNGHARFKSSRVPALYLGGRSRAQAPAQPGGILAIDPLLHPKLGPFADTVYEGSPGKGRSGSTQGS